MSKLRLQRPEGLRPEIVGVEIMPALGWKIAQIYAFIPGHGRVSLTTVVDKYSGAWLIPFANRLRGPIRVGDREMQSPAGALHGLLHESPVEVESVEATRAMGVLRAGNFGGEWFSSTEVRFATTITESGLILDATAKNVGDEILPMAIGWHPCFQIQRNSAQLKLPARNRLVRDGVFPTGEIIGIKGSPYDFSESRVIGDQVLDDAFVDLQESPSAIELQGLFFGIRITIESEAIRAIQVYAPAGASHVAIEPQFNWLDPFDSRLWRNKENTGVVLLKPGESTAYRITLGIY